MGHRGEDMQQMTTGRIVTQVTTFRTEPIGYVLYPVSPGIGYFLLTTTTFVSALAASSGSSCSYNCHLRFVIYYQMLLKACLPAR